MIASLLRAISSEQSEITDKRHDDAPAPDRNESTAGR
jgi:hypothetical protein